MTFHTAIGQSSDQVIKLFEAGEQQLNSGQYNDAIQSFGKVVALKVNHVDAYYYRGVAKEKGNDPEGALMDYSLALEWNANFAEALFARARVCYDLQRYDEAQADFNKLLTIPLGETHDILYRKSSYEDGINRIVTAQSATDIVYNYLGLIALGKENYTEAITWFDRAINLYDADADYYVNRGLANEKLQRYVEAKADFELAIQKSPDHGLAQQYLSSLARKQGDFAESDHYLSEAIERNPSLPFAFLERAYYRSEEGNYNGAIEDYSAALKIDSLDEEVWVNRGLAYEKTGALSAAYHDFTQAITLKENYPNAWLCRANILVKQERFKEAIEDYGIAILYDPGYPLAYYNRAIIRYRIGEKSAACEDLIKAETLGQSVQENIKTALCENGL